MSHYIRVEILGNGGRCRKIVVDQEEVAYTRSLIGFIVGDCVISLFTDSTSIKIGINLNYPPKENHVLYELQRLFGSFMAITNSDKKQEKVL